MCLKWSILGNKVTLLTQAVWVVHGTYFVNNGPKGNWFYVHWADCLCAIEQEREGAYRGVGAVRPGLISQCNYIFMIFVYLSWMQRASTPLPLLDFLLFVCCESMHWSKVHSSRDNPAHIHTISRTSNPCSRWSACSHPAREASSCSTYTHSFPSPPPPPQSHPHRLATRVLSFLWEVLSHPTPPNT